ncbi:sensor histidine kinase [Candidatus Entotheonella palauensis]|uniref:sensor histidine kinase n=1 Tax=Candidatus Entotheonella palauensis TaxID=93172 RepID=UPI0015C46E12|nr:sensor histidine kinase [Candidatus Entotheonella palauensis]
MTQAAISLENARLYSDLQSLNADLETRVHQRTQQLQQAQQELIAQAHRAGMADIAANVLHNVGNVLNSVTTSASVIATTVHDSHLTKLFKANELLRQQADDLEHFVSADDKAVKLLRYYLLLDEPLHHEQHEVLSNIEVLQTKIRLINEIVVAQQSYAQGGALVEGLELEEEVELALTLQGSSVERHGVLLEREYARVGRVQGQRTKLVHVLVNLLKNATEAMGEVSAGEKHLRVVIESDATRAYIRVSDTGCGILSSELESIFTHGMTTKAEGHGFGLHSSANYMTEMGGWLWAESGGEGEGATFVIALPYEGAAELESDR